MLIGWANATGSGIAEAARLIEAEIEGATAVGPLPQYYLGLAAEVLLAAARPADALAHLDRAIAGIDQPGIGVYLPEIYRLRAHGSAGDADLRQDGDAVDRSKMAKASAEPEQRPLPPQTTDAPRSSPTAPSPGSSQPGIGVYLPEIYRLRALCLAPARSTAATRRRAKSHFTTAIEIARRQGATLLERRAEASLSELTM